MENQVKNSPTTTEKSVAAGLSSGKTQIPSTFERLLTVSSVTLGNILILGGGGYLADQYFSTKPWLLIVGLVIAAVASQVMIYRRLMAVLNKKED